MAVKRNSSSGRFVKGKGPGHKAPQASGSLLGALQKEQAAPTESKIKNIPTRGPELLRDIHRLERAMKPSLNPIALVQRGKSRASLEARYGEINWKG